MNYLITGASGFIGKALVRDLLARGHTVNYLARKREQTMDSRAAFFLWNSTREEPPLDCMGRLDAIVHLAGEPVAQRWNAEVKQRIRSSRIDGTRNLVSAIGKLKHKPAVLVSASAVGYYAPGEDRVLTEEAPAGNGFLSEICVAWEREAVRARDFGLRVVLPRISIVLGPGGGALAKMLTPFRLGLGARLGNGKQWMPWIHRDDLLRLLRFMAENGELSGPVNAASPNPVTNAIFTRELAKAVGRPALFAIPALALRLLAGEMAQQMLDSLRVAPKVAQTQGFTFGYCEIREALKSVLS